MALVEKAFGDIITFTRASGGGRINALGQYEWVADNVPRLTHDPVTLQPLGLLVEEQRTNLIRHSANLANVAWSKAAGVSISTDGQLAPDGTQMQLITLAGTTNHNINQVLLAPLATGQAHTISVYVKPKSAPFPFQIAYYDGSTSLNATLITPVAGETQRIEFTFTPTVVAAAPQIRILGFGNGGNGDQVYIWGVQLEAGPTTSSYIPTEASQVTRASDVVSVNTLSPWYNPLEGTIVLNTVCGQGSASLPTAAALSDGTNANYMSFMIRNATNVFRAMTVRVANTEVVALSPASVSFGSVRCAGSYKENSFSASFNGGVPATDTLGAVPVVSQLAIGRLLGGNHFNGIIQSITYYPRVIDVQQASA